MKCSIPGCKNDACYETDKRTSKLYCKEHIKGIKTVCSICHKELILRPSRYINNVKNNKPIICKSCGCKIRLQQYKESPEGREESRKRMLKWRNTDKVKAKLNNHLKQLNGKNGILAQRRKTMSKEELYDDTMARFLGIPYNDFKSKSKDEKQVLINNFYDNRKTGGGEPGIGFHMEYCSKCDEVTLHSGPKYFKCNNIVHAFGYRYCGKCKKETWHIGNRCYECDPWENFNRNSFYSNSLNLIKFKSLNRSIIISDIDQYKGIPGVWCKLDSNGKVLDVSQTKDIQKEILFSIRALALGKKNINLSDSEIENKYKYKPGLYKKYRDLAKYGIIIFKIIAIEKNKEKRLNIEAQYAHDTKAEFWNP
jgi:hypothetical protein